MEKGLFGLRNVLAAAQGPALHAALAEWGIETYRLDGRTVQDRASFFAQARIDLPRPAGAAATDDWAAWTDHFAEYCAGSPASEFAIVWTHVEEMLHGGLPALLEASDALLGLARQLYSPASPNSRRKVLYLFLLGEGPNFPPLETGSPA